MRLAYNIILGENLELVERNRISLGSDLVCYSLMVIGIVVASVSLV